MCEWSAELKFMFSCHDWAWRQRHVVVNCVWNVLAHAQKPDFVFRRNGRVHLNRREPSVQPTTGSRGVRISGNNAGYTMFRGSYEEYWLPTPFASLPFISPPVRHRVPSHFNWTIPTVNPLELPELMSYTHLFPHYSGNWITWQVSYIGRLLLTLKVTSCPWDLWIVTVCQLADIGCLFSCLTDQRRPNAPPALRRTRRVGEL